jgi:Tetracyclin repressor-like, C-terminal domain
VLAATLFAHDSVAFEDRIRDFRDSVLFDEYDLAEYGGRMFDKFEGAPRDAAPGSLVPKVGRIAAVQREGKVSRTYPAVALLGLARSTAMIWHTQMPGLASLFPSDRRDQRDVVVRVIRQILDQ